MLFWSYLCDVNESGLKIQRRDHKIVNKYTKTILWPNVIAHPLINFGSQVFGPIYFGGLSW
jgi:hypothetical protein